MISDLSVIKQVLNRNKSNLAFIVGNGINRFAYAQNQDVSWNALLLDINNTNGKIASLCFGQTKTAC